jgi:hypothetical protein
MPVEIQLLPSFKLGVKENTLEPIEAGPILMSVVNSVVP